ncbi:UNVERIFIED_CONTAM: hypothetical protein NCL1_39824 [Trichonephila clavipes]
MHSLTLLNVTRLTSSFPDAMIAYAYYFIPFQSQLQELKVFLRKGLLKKNYLRTFIGQNWFPDLTILKIQINLKKPQRIFDTGPTSLVSLDLRRSHLD